MFLYNCNDVNFLRLIMYIKEGLSIVFLIIPIILIVSITIDFTKGIINVDDGFKKMWQIIGKRIIAILLLFFTPTIVNAVLSTIGNVTENSLSCYNQATSENIETIIVNNVETYLSKIDKDKITLSQLSELEKRINKIQNKSTKESYQTKLNEYKKIYNDNEKKKEEEYQKNRSEARKKQESNNSSSSNTKNKTIIIGDSEVVNMCENYGLCNNDIYFAKGGVFCDYMETIKSSVNNKIGNDEYNIVIILGFNGAETTTNSGTNEAERCFRKIDKLARNDWKKQNIVYLSVNPCDDYNAARNGMIITNIAINAFNRTMESKINSANLSNLKYCDTNSSLSIKEIDSGDGAHYNEKGAKQVYDMIKSKCLK